MQEKSKAQLDTENGGSLEAEASGPSPSTQLGLDGSVDTQGAVFSSPRYMPHSPTPSSQLPPSSPSSVPHLSSPQTASIPSIRLKLQRSVAAIIDGDSAVVADAATGAGQAPASASGSEIAACHISARRSQPSEADHQAEAAQQVGHGRFSHSTSQASSGDVLGQLLARVADLEGEVRDLKEKCVDLENQLRWLRC